MQSRCRLAQSARKCLPIRQKHLCIRTLAISNRISGKSDACCSVSVWNLKLSRDSQTETNSLSRCRESQVVNRTLKDASAEHSSPANASSREAMLRDTAPSLANRTSAISRWRTTAALAAIDDAPLRRWIASTAAKRSAVVARDLPQATTGPLRPAVRHCRRQRRARRRRWPRWPSSSPATLLAARAAAQLQLHPRIGAHQANVIRRTIAGCRRSTDRCSRPCLCPASASRNCRARSSRLLCRWEPCSSAPSVPACAAWNRYHFSPLDSLIIHRSCELTRPKPVKLGVSCIVRSYSPNPLVPCTPNVYVLPATTCIVSELPVKFRSVPLAFTSCQRVFSPASREMLIVTLPVCCAVNRKKS